MKTSSEKRLFTFPMLLCLMVVLTPLACWKILLRCASSLRLPMPLKNILMKSNLSTQAWSERPSRTVLYWWGSICRWLSYRGFGCLRESMLGLKLDLTTQTFGRAKLLLSLRNERPAGSAGASPSRKTFCQTANKDPEPGLSLASHAQRSSADQRCIDALQWLELRLPH